MSFIVALWRKEPDVPVTTMEEVPAGVPNCGGGGALELPLLQATHNRASAIATAYPKFQRRSDVDALRESPTTIKAASATRRAVSRFEVGYAFHGKKNSAAVVRAVVVTLTVMFALLEPSSSVDDGDTLQADCAGAPVQLQVTV